MSDASMRPEDRLRAFETPRLGEHDDLEWDDMTMEQLEKEANNATHNIRGWCDFLSDLHAFILKRREANND